MAWKPKLIKKDNGIFKFLKSRKKISINFIKSFKRDYQFPN